MTATNTTTTTAAAVARHRKESRRRLRQVDDALARGDIEQASQCLWDAAALAIKAAAARRGWEHNSHYELGEVITRLHADEGGPKELHWYFIMASSFDRKDRAWEIPRHEAGIRYCRTGPVMELLQILESMDK